MKRAHVFLSALAILLISPVASAGDGGLAFRTALTGGEEVPPVITDTTGEAEFVVRDFGTRVDFELEIENAVGILGAAGAHIHCGSFGENGPVVVFLAGVAPPAGFDGSVEIEASFDGDSILDESCGSTLDGLIESMMAGDTYVNVHSLANPAGEVRGQIELVGDDDDDDEDSDDHSDEDSDDDSDEDTDDRGRTRSILDDWRARTPQGDDARLLDGRR